MIHVDLVGDRIAAHIEAAPEAFDRHLNILKAIPSSRVDRKTGKRVFDATSGVAYEIERICRSAAVELRWTETFLQLLKKAIARRKIIANPADYHGEIADWTGLPLRAHQRAGARLIAVSDGCYLAWEMGTGKTLCAVAAAKLLALARVLVVCPKRVAPAWERHFREHDPNRVVVMAHDGSTKVRAGMIRQAMDGTGFLGGAKQLAVVVNYEGLIQDAIRDLVLEIEWDLLVGDEAHRLKSATGVAAKLFGEIRKNSHRCVLLSGTPIQSNPDDLYMQCRVLDPGIFGTSKSSFMDRYAIFGAGDQVVGFNHLDQIAERFGLVAFRVKKSDVLELPPETTTIMEIDISAKARKIYDSIRGSLVADIDDSTKKVTVTSVLTELLRLQQVTGGSVRFDDDDRVTEVDTAKRDALQEMMEDLPRHEPLVVFCRFKHDIEQVRRAAEASKRQCAVVAGGESGEGLARWQNAGDGCEPSVVAVQIDAGGEGIDLSRACRSVFYSLGFSFGRFDQAKARLHRMGQKRNVEHTMLVVRDSIDEVIHAILDAKGRRAEQVVDAGSETSRFTREVVRRVLGRELSE